MRRSRRRSASWIGSSARWSGLRTSRVDILVAAAEAEPVMEALCDDLNTPLALSAMHALADRALAGDFEAACGLRAAGALLGIVQQSVDQWFRSGGDHAAIEAAIAERQDARRKRDYKRADAIRAEWAARGIVFEDRPDGSTGWSSMAVGNPGSEKP